MMGPAHFRFKARGAMLLSAQQGCPAMPDIKTLYDEDFLAWSQQQVEVLRETARAGTNQKLDYENLAEEIEGLGISQQSALGSQIKRIILHLLKLQHSPALNPRHGWENSVIDARDRIEDLIKRSPSLRGDVPDEIRDQSPRAARMAIRELGKRAELATALTASIQATTYTPDQILDDWFPPAPQG
jgi:hypothetical protein